MASPELSTRVSGVQTPTPAMPQIGVESSFLSTVRPTPHDQRLAFAIMMASTLAFIVTAPFAKTQLTPLPAFLPIYQTAVIISDVITSILLLGQYDILRSRRLFVIAAAYFFNAAMAVFHALSFPGLFAPAGLLGSGPQTTAWLYFFWHGAFPLFVIAYALLTGQKETQRERHIPLVWTAVAAWIVAVAVASILMLLATSGSRFLPEIMSGNVDTDRKVLVAVAVWALSLAALALLWRRTQHTLLDMWLMVIMCIWIFDVALAAVLNHGRYDVGWYMGRVYGLVTAGVVLLALLIENGKLYGRLATASARERAYLSNLHDPVITIDGRGIVLGANPALERVLGYAPEELLGRNISMLMPEPHRGEHDEYLRRYLTTREPHIIGQGRELFGRHKNGELVPLHLTANEVALDGESLFVGTLHDLRDRNRLFEELTRARSDAEQANRAKSAFLATMSHEIRTPMNGVMGMIEVLAHSRLSEHQADLVRTIRESASTLLVIIDDILDFSKIEAGRLEFERQPISISDLIEGLCNSMVTVASGKDVDLDVFVSPDIPDFVLSDDVRLRQVIYNLVGNAIKFSAGRREKRGHVFVRVDVQTASPLRLSFRIEDNGIGIPAEALKDLFTPFTQAEISTTRLFGGTGLGLAICKRLADLMDGEIEVTSAPGVGSVFTVRLPFEPAPEPRRRPRPDITGCSCILIDNDAINANDLRAYLERAGADVRLVKNAEEATQAARHLGTVVVVQGATCESFSEEALHKAFAAAPDARHLVIMRHPQQHVRVQPPDIVIIDGDALRRDVFLRAVAVAAGFASPEMVQDSPQQSFPEQAEPPSVAEARAAGTLILIAEDDETNQKVILRQLALLGYAAEVASNGREALRLWRDGKYALLLTDLHMPEMDGYTLASTIRIEEEEGGDRMPILALTANALHGEANRARMAGVDEYLTKPVKLDLLKSALDRWMPAPSAAALQPQTTDPVGRVDGVLNVEVLKSLVGGEEAVIRELLEHFLLAARTAADEIRDAYGHADYKKVSGVAHKLKSSSRSVGAIPLGDLCAELENAGKAEHGATIEQCKARVETALAAVEARISELLAERQI
ncbi:MASE4 domain-containing protein [Parvibaculum sp.]|uniref:MASE4 domain-containing protein n=1 Tax=Parvibaculum sp. TaxID=2024848 RepID=UPI00320EF8C3